MTRVLVIGGSLREGSYTSALARAGRELAPTEWDVELMDDLGALPHYDADLDTDDAPPPVRRLRERIGRADALLIVTPEYNGSVPGVLKNAVDWASRPHRRAALSGKPVAVVSASPGAYGALWAQNDLRRILGIAGARVVDDELAVPHVDELIAADGSVTDGALRRRLRGQLDALADEAGGTGRVAA
jgi:chromate reductase, NAD(P)H dehydrogenase (quinone)